MTFSVELFNVAFVDVDSGAEVISLLSSVWDEVVDGLEDTMTELLVVFSLSVGVVSDLVDGRLVIHFPAVDVLIVVFPYVVKARAKKRKRKLFPTVCITEWGLLVLTPTKLTNDDGKIS